jgi:hypothetical protein
VNFPQNCLGAHILSWNLGSTTICRVATSISGSFGLNCHMISQKIILRHILVLMALKFV